jgi:ABC-type Fe3+/spermidine/putrescine transport system ATPase subunit
MSGERFEFRAVSKDYDGYSALVEVSFALASGEHTALIGPSGCGKSTALRLLAGLEIPSAGQVLLGDQVVSEPGRILIPPHRRGVALVFQDLALWPNLSVLDNVLLGLAGTGLSRSEARACAREALTLCGIVALAARRPGRISGGQQQRVALARALAPRPKFLLLDEPFAGLDLMTRARLLREVAALAVERGLTLLLVTHDPLEAASLCHCAVVLEEGRMVETGPLADLLRNPQSQMLQTFRDHLRGLALSDTESPSGGERAGSRQNGPISAGNHGSSPARPHPEPN